MPRSHDKLNAMNVSGVLRFLVENLQRRKIDFALIGGLALPTAGVLRATRDVDLLIPQEHAQTLKELMLSHGFELLHENPDVATYVGKKMELGRVDFLLAHRKYAQSMLQRAPFQEVMDGRFKVKVLAVEDLIGLKVQSSTNDPGRRHQDMSDVEELIRQNQKSLDMSRVKEYFDLFDRGKELDEILKRLKEC